MRFAYSIFSPQSVIASLLVSLSLTTGLTQSVQAAPKPSELSPATQRLMKMFSPEIQMILGACLDQGQVNLSQGPDQDGSVICGNGTRNSPIAYNTYVSTLADLLTASSLVGIQVVLKSNPEIQPEMIVAALNTSNGVSLLRTQLQQGIANSDLVSAGSTQSVDVLVEQIMQRLLPAVKNTKSLNQLFGTPTQYQRVVSKFCQPPGASVNQMQKITPDLSTVQLYAICIQESGLAEEMLKMK